MRLRFVSSTLLCVGVLHGSFVRVARAGEPARTAAQPGDATEAARAHFKNGVKLYQDGNYGAALTEFQAAYELKPGPGSLQNVALCQKALFRYGEAADTLARLLARHGTELSGAERSAAEQARGELEALVGSVRLVLSPANADVSVDGRPLPTDERTAALRLNVGEHTFTASAPGYTSATERIQVASAQKDVAVKLELSATSAFVDVRSNDAGASIAIDGKPVAFGHVLAPVTPGTEHLVQIYEDGAAPFEQRVTAALGQTVVVSGEPGLAPLPHDATPPAVILPLRPKPAVGWFAEGSLGLLATSSTPFRFEMAEAKSSAWGLGARAGYRLQRPLAVALHVEFDVLKVRHACDPYAGELAPTPILCGDPNEVVANYLVRSLRFGPTVELMSTGPELRALTALSLGPVWHEIRLGTQRKNGVDPYLLVEAGVAANGRHALFALTLEALIDGTRNMIEDRTLGPGDSVHEQAFARSNRALAYLGINLRAGYSAWSP